MRTVGVEEELLLVDAGTGRPRAVAAQVLRLAEERGQTASTVTSAVATAGTDTPGGTLAHELQQEQLEIDTHPHTDLAPLEDELREWRRTTSLLVREAGARVLATGTSPLPAEPQLVSSTRYREIAEHFGLTASEQLTCGCHVHVSVDSDDEAVGVLDRIQVWLPVLLAVSANSPFWQGAETGYASYRSQAMARWPTAGPCEVFGTAAEYRRQIELMIGSGVPLDEGMIYSDARASHHYPTVEIRVADVCGNVSDTVLIAALCRALVETAAVGWAEDRPAPAVSTRLVRLASWQAGRAGVEGQLIDPVTLRPAPARMVVDALLAVLTPALEATGDADLAHQRVDELFSRGTGATRQRAVLAKTGQLIDVISDLASLTAGHVA